MEIAPEDHAPESSDSAYGRATSSENLVPTLVALLQPFT